MQKKTTQKRILSAKKWDITDNRYVAYIDIMGFKDLVARSKHEDIYGMMKKIAISKKINSSVNWGHVNSNLISTTMYSDSIMLYSKDGSYESLYSLICATSSLISDLFMEGIPHKGSLAYGIMTLDSKQSIFFGQPLIDSFLLQEELYFYGIVVHATVEEKINSFKESKKKFVFVKDYSCYFKNGNSKNLVVYPMLADSAVRTLKDSKEEVAIFDNSIRKLRNRTSGQLRKYIDNTETFLNDISKEKS
jgi:hypothetical protein